ncbi:unnamed protein product [Rotaria sp. Silwood1]|nr:unnamed protein product [Rotaria sp. Silwood1]
MVKNENFAQQTRSLPALAFLPTTDVITTFDEIKAQFPAEGESVLKYFEEHYRFKKEQCYVDAQIIQAEADVRQARRREQIRR